MKRCSAAAFGPERRPRVVRGRDRAGAAATRRKSSGRRRRAATAATGAALARSSITRGSRRPTRGLRAPTSRRSRVLDGIGVAREVLPGMGGRMILHAGPPIAWDAHVRPDAGRHRRRDPATKAGRTDADAARRAGGERRRSPSRRAITTPRSARWRAIISPSMPVWIVRTPNSGNRAFSNLNEGLGKVLRFGANSPEVIDRCTGWRRCWRRRLRPRSKSRASSS